MKNIVSLAVAVEGVEGFMPASHVELRRVEDFSDYIGKGVEAEVIELIQQKRLVVSRRFEVKNQSQTA
ncbi:MAG: S1 RNA-binding domain-containing protein [Phascolarctobacterium faecium]